LTLWEIADEIGISRGSANMGLTEDLGMQRAEKFVPKLLSLEKGSRVPDDCDHW
jgi:hypothetical protein